MLHHNVDFAAYGGAGLSAWLAFAAPTTQLLQDANAIATLLASIVAIIAGVASAAHFIRELLNHKGRNDRDTDG